MIIYKDISNKTLIKTCVRLNKFNQLELFYYDEYKKVMSRYVDQDLDLFIKRFDAYKKNDVKMIDKIQEEQNAIKKRKYLYTTNFAVNHPDAEVSPYVTLAEIYDINFKYLDTIQKTMTPRVAKTLYGKKFMQYYSERQKMEK